MVSTRQSVATNSRGVKRSNAGIVRNGSKRTMINAEPLGTRAVKRPKKRRFISSENRTANAEVKHLEKADNFIGTSGAKESRELSAVHSGCASYVLSGRARETAFLESRLENSIKCGTPVSLYISGPPGTGKTATVTAVLKELSTRHKELLFIYVNCVSVNTETALLKAIISKFKGAPEQVAVSELAATLEKLFISSAFPIVVVLDELDFIKSHSFLYAAFQWPVVHSSVSLLGIANSLDLTERILPKLKLTRSPEILPFLPYSRTDLQEILLRKLSAENCLDRRALELCSRKVARMTGDVRTAIGIAQQTLSGMQKATPEALKNGCVPEQSACSRVLSALSNTYCSPLVRTRIPLQQKVILATMLRLAEKHSCTTIDKDSLICAYCKVCGMLSLPPLDADGVRTTLSLLESQSFIECKSSSCQLLVDVSVAKEIVADSALLAQISDLSLR